MDVVVEQNIRGNYRVRARYMAHDCVPEEIEITVYDKNRFQADAKYSEPRKNRTIAIESTRRAALKAAKDYMKAAIKKHCSS